jgi:Mg2+ and Co2+ transporter CorA
MSTTSNQELATAIDKEFRDAHGLTTETTYAFLARRARTDDSTDFVSNMYQALYWLLPQLTERTRPLYDEMITLLDALDDTLHEMSEDKLLYNKEQVMHLFEQANSLIRYEPTLAAQEAFNQAQSARASKPRKLSEEQTLRIAKVYWEAKREGGRRGVVKELAREFGVSVTRVQAIAKKLNPDNSDN